MAWREALFSRRLIASRSWMVALFLWLGIFYFRRTERSFADLL